ncbi:MAG: OFA family MFS transporter [Emergencia sp.]
MTIENFKSRRSIIFTAALITAFCAGFGYSWSILQSSIMQNNPDWAPSAIAIAYTLQVSFSCLSPVPLAPVIQKLSVRQNIIVGGILYGVGLFSCGFVTSLPMLYLFYGILAGVGVGFIYPQMMSYSVKVLPDKGSLASGMMAAAYGSGAVIWAPVAQSLINGLSLATTFKILGAVYLVAILAMSCLLKDIPEGYAESFRSGDTKKEEASSKPKTLVPDKTRSEMMKTSTCWLMLIGFALSLTSGMLAISQAKGIVANTAGGTFAVHAALCVSVITLFNTVGRLVWGTVSTKIGIYNVMIILCAFAALCMGALSLISGGVLVVAFLALTASCFGGFATLLTPMTADFFGYKNLTVNFGFMYIAFAIASLIGPRLATSLVSVNGDVYSYSQAYIIGAALSVVGLVCAFILKKRHSNLS